MVVRKKLLILACGVCAAMAGATPGSAQVAGRFVATPPFSAIVLDGTDRLRFVDGPRTGVIAGPGAFGQGDAGGLVHGSTLIVAGRRRFDLVAATAPTIRLAVVNGTGDLDLDTVTGPSFDGVVHGPGRLSIGSLRVPQARILNAGVGDLVVRSVQADTLVIEMHGPGDVRVTGAARSVSIIVTGSGDCDARGLAAGNLSVTVAGSGNVQARSSGTARINASGSGNVVVNGRPQCQVRAAGVGEVVCG